MESALAERAETEAEAPYVRGDLFCVEDYAHFLLFGEEVSEGVRAGIIYEGETPEPLEKLDAFCRSIRAALETAHGARRVRASPIRPSTNTGQAASPVSAASLSPP